MKIMKGISLVAQSDDDSKEDQSVQVMSKPISSRNA